MQITQLADERRDLKAELATRKKQRTRAVRASKQNEEDFAVGDAARYFAVNRWAFVPNQTWLGEDIDNVPDDEPNLEAHVIPKKRFLLDYIGVLPVVIKDSYADSDIRSVVRLHTFYARDCS